MELDFRTESVGGKGLITLEGDLDNEQAGEALRRAFQKLFDQGERTIVLDLTNVQIINSYGIGKILICYRMLKTSGGVLMVRPLSGFVKETFELLMLDRLFPVDDGSSD